MSEMRMPAPRTPSHDDIETVHAYVIGQSWQHPVMIGAAHQPSAHLHLMQAGSPVPLVLLWSSAATESAVVRMHEALAAMRTHGDWFDLSHLANPLYLISRLAGEAGLADTMAAQPAEALAAYRQELLAEVAQIEKAMRPEVVEAVRSGRMSRRAASRTYGLSRETVKAWIAAAARDEADRIRRERTKMLKALAPR